MGDRNAAWQPGRPRGQSSGDGVSARCTDRSVNRCVDRPTDPSVRACVAWPGRRGGSASAACAMAQPWTTVAWAVWPAPPNDPTTLGRGRSNAEPTACRSGVAATLPAVRKAHERVAHSHRATEVRGMPGGEARAARGGELAGAPTPRSGGSPVAAPSQPPSVSGCRLRHHCARQYPLVAITPRARDPGQCPRAGPSLAGV
jgi:hypothetical protein